MPFNPTASVISTDLDNMLRGLYRDNSDRIVTGTNAETPMAGLNISPNVIGATGALLVIAGGTCVGAAGVKNVRLYFGGVLVQGMTVPAGTQCWFMKAWIFNTSVNTQRIVFESYTIPAAVGIAAPPVLSHAFGTMTVDTSQNQVLQTRTQNAGAPDTCTNTIFDVFVVQIN